MYLPHSREETLGHSGGRTGKKGREELQLAGTLGATGGRGTQGDPIVEGPKPTAQGLWSWGE